MLIDAESEIRSMPSALVLGSHTNEGLVSVRSLGSRGVRVTAASPKRWSAGRLSKHADGHLRYPFPDDDASGFLRSLLGELRRGDYDMLLPVEERTLEWVIGHRPLFEAHTNLPFPPSDRLRIGLDKRRTIEAAREFDVPHPETLFSAERSVDDVEEALGYPVVVKPARGAGRRGVAVCESRAELEAAVDRQRRTGDPALFQEFVPNGGERGVYALYNWSSELSAVTVQRRIRTNPPEGGASTYRETVEDPELVSLADEFLTALDWQGVAMVEMRIDARTGEPKLMEINPRLWGSLALSVHAGVDFPSLLYLLAVGEDVEPNLRYRTGVRARCLSSDLLQVLRRADRMRALTEFLTPSSKPGRFDVLSASDPLPAVGHAFDCLTDLRDSQRGTARDAADRETPTEATAAP